MADDWFSDLVRTVADEVVNSAETQAQLARVPGDRVTARDLRAEADRGEGELRVEFARAIAAVQDIDDARQKAVRDVLSREFREIGLAEERLYQATAAADTPVRPGRSGWLARPRRSADAGERAAAIDAAQAALDAANTAYETAAASDDVARREQIAAIDAERSEKVAVLRHRLYAALVLAFNEVIDAALEASYERYFSYVGTARLTDLLDADAPFQKSVNAEADRQLQYLIEKVGSGAVGVAGPRGSGKTTLLRRLAVTVPVNEKFRRQFGVYVSAPARYDPREFLLYLFGQLCVEVLGEQSARWLEEELTKTALSGKRIPYWVSWLLVTAATAVLGCLGLVIGLRTARLGESPGRMTDLLIASCCAFVAFVAFMMPEIPRILLISGGAENLFSHPHNDSLHRKLVRARLCVFWLSGITAVTLFSLLGAGAAPGPGYIAAAAFGVATAAGLYAVSWVPGARFRRLFTERPPEPVADSASALAAKSYVKVKFQQSFTTGWSGTVTLGTSSLPLQLQGGKSSSAGVTPLAMSVPEIVDGFNALAGQLATEYSPPPGDRIPVIVGIDEVDKIEDPAEAQAFFNQIKVLFGDSQCLFLISVSDDAMAAFERRGMPFRDAFDSSLTTVVTLTYLPREEARRLIGSRLVGVQEPAADLLFMLSGGLPRELVRLVRRAVEIKETAMDGDGGPCRLDHLAVALTTAEVQAQQRAVLARGRGLDPCAAKNTLLTWAGRRQVAAADAAQYFAALFEQAGTLTGACDGDASSGTARAHAGSCPAEETGAFLFWLATMGQTFLKCSSRADFEAAESADGEKSFERLAEARQNFSLGPDYVLAASRAVRAAWGLDKEPLAQETRQ